jgi:von Willebrand factor type A domain
MFRSNSACTQSGDLVFVVDSSGSIGKANFLLVTSFISNIIQNLDVDTAIRGSSTGGFRIGLLTFSSSVNVFLQLNSNYINKAALLRAVNVPYITGTTNTADAIT